MSAGEATTMEFTGERFVTTETGEIKYEHLHRYALSLDFVTGKKVLDIASGEGYGAALLAQTAQFVTGVDIDSATINHAKHKYYLPNLNFEVGSCDAIPLADSSMDVVTSFETIEHHDQHQSMMREIKRVLKPDGILIISSPNRLTYSDQSQSANEFHVKELYFDEFQELLKEYFRHVNIYGQRLATASFVTPLQKSFQSSMKVYTGDVARVNQQIDSLPWPVYFIAICSDSQPTDQQTLNSIYFDANDDILKNLEGHRSDLLKEIDNQKKARARALELQSETFEAQLKEVSAKHQALLDEKEKQLEASELKAQEYADQLSQSKQNLTVRNENHLEKSQPGLGPLSESLLLSEIQQQLAERDQYLRAKDIQLQEMEKRVLMYAESGSYKLGRTLTRPFRALKNSLR